MSEANARLGRATIARMLKKGWLVRHEELPPPRIRPKVVKFARLALSPEAARERLPELRRAPKQVEVVNILLRRGEPLALSELRQMTACSAAMLESLQECRWIALEERSIWRDPLVDKEFVLTSPPPFTEGQEQVWTQLSGALVSDESHVFLLHGVTGSGKTEIYLRAVTETLKQGKQAIILVPEIALTPQTIRRFAARFPGRLAVLHSQLAAGERPRRMATNPWWAGGSGHWPALGALCPPGASWVDCHRRRARKLVQTGGDSRPNPALLSCA